MNKAETIQTLATKADLTQAQAKAALEALLAAWTEALAGGEVIALAGFGNFKTTQRAARNGINPKTKQPIKIPAKTAVTFKPASALKEAVNE
jgi:DNA-binding protein HU-beta